MRIVTTFLLTSSLVGALAGCGATQPVNTSGQDPCYDFYYHNFGAEHWSSVNNTSALTTVLRRNAPPGCNVQTSNTYGDGPGIVAEKTIIPAAVMGGSLVGAAAVLRPPEYRSYSNIQNGTGSSFAGGQGGAASATQGQTAAGGTGGAGGSASARGGNTTFRPGAVTASANNGGVRVNNANTNVANASSRSSSSAIARQRQGQSQYQDQSQGQSQHVTGGGSGGWNGGGNQWDPVNSGQNNNWNGNSNGGFMPIMN